MLAIRLWSFLSTFNPLSFLTGNLISVGVVVALIVAVFSWDHQRIERNRAEERIEVISEVNNANNRATEAGQASANSSGRSGVRGMRSPRYRD